MFLSLKKIISLAVLIILAFGIFPTAALASNETTNVTYDNGILNKIDNTNEYVYKAIERAGEEAVKEVLNSLQKTQKELSKLDKLDGTLDETKRQEEAAKMLEKIEELEQKLNQTIDSICEKLVEKTDNKVAELIEKAAKNDIEITKQYIEVTIHDHAILVDPCLCH